MAMVTGSTALPFSHSWLGIDCTMSVCQKVSIISILVHELFCSTVLQDNNMICALHLYSCIVLEGIHDKVVSCKNFTELFQLSFIASNHSLYMNMSYKYGNINKKHVHKHVPRYCVDKVKVKDRLVIWQTGPSLSRNTCQ